MMAGSGRQTTAAAVALIVSLCLITGSTAQSLQFTEPTYPISVEETLLDSYPPGVSIYPDAGSPRPTGSIGDVGCVDITSGGPVNVSYSIIEASNGSVFEDPGPGPFDVDPVSGSISVTADLDYEVKTSYTFHVRCRHVTQTSLTATATVEISVLPINEYAPEAEPNLINIFNVDESLAIGTVVVSPAGGSGLHTYELTDLDEGGIEVLKHALTVDPIDITPNTQHFSLNPNTGALTLTGSLDVDIIPLNGSTDIVFVSLAVCDVDPPSVLCPNVKVRIFIAAANDNPPVFERDTYQETVPEDLPVNSTLDPGIVCTDDDRVTGSLQGIELSNQSLSMWAVNSEGIVTLREPLDFETSECHEFTIKCLDTGGEEDEAIIVINVGPVNDNPLRFEDQRFTATVNRIEIPDKTLGSVRAIDDDMGEENTITYSIIRPNENFEIDEDTGEITMVDYIWAYEGNSFSLEVLAIDSSGDNATVEVDITVTGLLCVPEYILVAVSAFLFILLAAAIFICVCTYHCVKWRRKPLSRRDSQLELKEYVDMPAHMMPPIMFAHVPTMMNPHYPYPEEDYDSHEEFPSLSGTDEADFPDTLDSTLPSESRLYHMGPILQEVVDIFHDGDKMLHKSSKK